MIIGMAMMRNGGRAAFPHRVADMVGHGATSTVVAAFAHPPRQVGNRCLLGVKGHGSGLGNRVGINPHHSWSTGQHGFGDGF